jgi:hypothetical protein
VFERRQAQFAEADDFSQSAGGWEFMAAFDTSEWGRPVAEYQVVFCRSAAGSIQASGVPPTTTTGL